ncbi:MAG: DUF3343 domain-containing protein [Clostridiales bacterium]|nr:DUF3343 domain-containing protein [Clostridiales bacterium]
MYCIAVFRSRTHTIGFLRYLRSQGVEAKAVNTPAEAKVGCGISARFPCEYTKFSKQVISALGLTSFRGFYSVKKEGIRQTVVRIV